MHNIDPIEDAHLIEVIAKLIDAWKDSEEQKAKFALGQVATAQDFVPLRDFVMAEQLVIHRGGNRGDAIRNMTMVELVEPTGQ